MTANTTIGAPHAAAVTACLVLAAAEHRLIEDGISVEMARREYCWSTSADVRNWSATLREPLRQPARALLGSLVAKIGCLYEGAGNLKLEVRSF